MSQQTNDKSVIQEAQQILVRLSQFTNRIQLVRMDGVYDPQTEEQIKAFQEFVSLPQTGVLDQQTFERLHDANTAIDIITSASNAMHPFERRLSEKKIGKGESHDLVMIIQIILNTLGVACDSFSNIYITGTFDSETEIAVKSFQEINDLPITGEVDLLTWNRLVQLYNKYVDSEGE